VVVVVAVVVAVVLNTFRFHKKRGIDCSTQQILASEGLCSMRFVMKNVLQELNLVTLHHETTALVTYARIRTPLGVPYPSQSVRLLCILLSQTSRRGSTNRVHFKYGLVLRPSPTIRQNYLKFQNPKTHTRATYRITYARISKWHPETKYAHIVQKLASSNLGRSIGYSTSDGEPLIVVPNLVPTDISIGSGDNKVVSSQHLKPPANATFNHRVILT